MDSNTTSDRDFKAFFDGEITPELAALEVARKTALKKIWLIGVPMMGAGVAGVIGSLIAFPGVSPWPVVLFSVLGFAGFALGAYFQGKFRNAFKETVLARICTFFGYGYTLKPQSDLPGRCRALNLVGGYNRSTVEDEITGTAKGVPLTLVEAHLKYRSSGKHSSTRTVFKGLILEARLPKPAKATVLVTDDRGWLADWFKAGRFKGGERIELEDQAFEEVFDVWASDPMEARALVSPILRAQLMALRQQLDGKVRLAFDGATMLVTLPAKKNYFEGASIRTSVFDVAHVEGMINDLKSVSALVETLGFGEFKGA